MQNSSCVAQCGVVRDLIVKAKNKYFSSLIMDNNQPNQKVLFSAFDKWENRHATQVFPAAPTSEHLADSFADFFVDKILTQSI